MRFLPLLIVLVPLHTALASTTTLMNSRINFDQDFISSDANARAMLTHDGSTRGLDKTTGAFSGNSPAKIAERGLTIEAQRQSWDIVSKAVVEQNLSDAKLGLLAIQWGLSPAIAGSDGSFPNQNKEVTPTMYSIHNKSVFLLAAARSLQLLKHAVFPSASVVEKQAFRSQVNAAILALSKSARWMASSQNTQDFFLNAMALGKQTNQLFFIATMLQISGVLTADKLLLAQAKVRIDQTLTLLTESGIFPEGSGNPNGYIFDSGYQTVSLELFAKYISTLQASPDKDLLIAKLQLATGRFLQTVRANGTINTSKNSRTEACGDIVPGYEIAKGTGIDRFPFRIRYLGKFLGQSDDYNIIADSIMLAGVSYDHIGCH